MGLYHFNGDYQDSSENGNHLAVENPHGHIGFDAGGCPWHQAWGGFRSSLLLSERTNDWSNWTRLYSDQLRYPGSGSWTVEALVFVSDNTTDSVTEPMSKGAWYHLAGVYDDVEGKIKLYMNGDLAKSDTGAAPEDLQNFNVYVGGS